MDFKKWRIYINYVLLISLVALILGGCGPDKSPQPTTEPPAPTPASIAPEPTATDTADTDDSDDTAVPPEEGDGYFDDAVFIGDSVSLKLRNYVTQRRAADAGYLGNAEFLVSGSLGSGNALWEIKDDSVHPAYNGEKMLLEDGVSKSGAKKLYIMLGVNDIVVYGIGGSVENMGKLLDNIKQKSPGIEIFVQSVLPVTRNGQKDKLNNAALSEYNEGLIELCSQNGYEYLDVASVIKDAEGYLPDEYSSDDFVHLTDEACELWIDYLRDHKK
ncbi:MAG: GDSL-type esterase/lipase family protein [Christensenellales bacterium]|jgi:hypothetical protein